MQPKKTLRVLILEDVPTDAELVEGELRSAGIEFVSERVCDRDSFRKALDRFSPDIILSDYSLPGFDGEAALSLARENVPDIPFIFVTGALGEERAVDLLKNGATDFVLKDRLIRLPLCLKRALEEAEEKRGRQRAEEELRRAHARVRERTIELEKLYEEQKIYTRMLEQGNRNLEDFVHVASHDLQEPLRKIQTFGDRLIAKNGESLDKSVLDDLQRMRLAARRMQDLVLDLLKYSRATSSPPIFKPIDLSETLNEAVSDLSVLFEEKEGHIEISELPEIEADRVQMHQLFQNLIGNSLKYRSEQKPVVKVSGRSFSSDMCEIHVEDNSIGFDERHLDKIFKPFRRLHGKNSQYGGNGMGLAICRRIVERHGGCITARSEPGKGATFIVRLPKKQMPLSLNHEK